MPHPIDDGMHPAGAEAAHVLTRTAAAGRWFGWYLAAFGAASAVWIVLLESVFPDGFSRGLTAGSWAVFVVLANLWAERHAVFPTGASRLLYGAGAVWFLLYLLVGGPLTRWQFDAGLLPWAAAAFLMSLPFFAAAAWLWSRR